MDITHHAWTYRLSAVSRWVVTAITAQD